MKFSISRWTSVTAFLFLTWIIGPAQKPELIVQTGHSKEVHAVAFSPDGKTLATGGPDGTIELWGASTGTELRTLNPLDWVFSVAFSPDGKTLASGSMHNIKLWDVSTGSELRTLKAEGGDGVAFSPNGKTLASTDNYTIKLWNVSTGAELRTLVGHSSRVHSVVFSPDGTTLGSGSEDHTVKLWDVSTGSELSTLNALSEVFSVAFSPDGKTLASGGDGVKLWDVSTGIEARTLRGHSPGVTSVVFSPNGKTLASCARGEINLWDVSMGSKLRTLKVSERDFPRQVISVAFSPDGKTLASGGDDVKIWDVSIGAELLTFKKHSNYVNSIAFSPDRKILAGGTKLWDVATGSDLRTLKGYSRSVTSVAFSPSGNTLAIGGFDSHMSATGLWDVSTGSDLRTLTGDNRLVTSVAFSPDGNTLATGSLIPVGSSIQTIKLWDVSTGAELLTFKGEFRSVTSVALSPDGKILATGSQADSGIQEYDYSVKLWDVSTGLELRTLRGHSSGGVRSVAFSPDGKTLASGGDEVQLWDVSTGAQLRNLRNGNSSFVFSVAFSPDGKTLASGGYDQTIKLWDVSTGLELHTLKGHSSDVTSVAFSPNGRILASGGDDGRINLWDVSSGNNLASLIALDEKDWLVATPDGLFDGSPAAWNQIIWRFDNNTFNYAPVEAYFNEFYYPGLLTDIFFGKRPKAPSDISQKDRRQPQLKLTLAEARPDVTLAARNLKVKIDVSQAPGGAQDVRLFRNGSLVKVWHGDVLRGQVSVTLDATIPIVAGENKLTAYAFNHDNIKSSDATLTVTGAPSLKRQGVGYVLAVGVNQYANSQYNLRYAVADAQDFAEELKRQQAKLNNYEHVEVIALNDKDATKANILKSLADLSAKIQPEDALVIFFAGHGTAQQNRFYLIPRDLGYTGNRTQLDGAALQNILTHSVSDEEISRAVEGIDAGQMLLVIDACNSGQALEAEEKRRGPMNSKGLAQLAYEKGMYILTAAQSYQAANEAERYGHGFLTYALVEEGLKTGAADKDPKDGQVLLREWLDYATERVPQMQQDKLEEQQKQGRQLDRIKFAEADSGNERSIQRPRVFYRRETETHPLVVARP